MSRDFSPDLDSFREVARETREKPPESSRTERGRASRQKNEDRDLSRLPEVQEARPREVPAKEARTVLYDRYRGYELRESEAQTLTDLGKFRVIAADDLARFAYNGDRARMEQETASLTRQGLVEKKRVETSLSRTTRMYTLTKTGWRLLMKSDRVAKGQEIYSGLVKPKEAKHDAELYRLYQKEASRIETRGGRVRRVVLDYELKKHVNRDLMRLGREKDDGGKKQEVAERYGLRVVRGRIPVPDMQIEYEMPEQGMARVNLELTTEDYRPRQLAQKAQAGFTIYSHREESARVRRILNDRELTAEVLSSVSQLRCSQAWLPHKLAGPEARYPGPRHDARIPPEWMYLSSVLPQALRQDWPRESSQSPKASVGGHPDASSRPRFYPCESGVSVP